MTCHGLSGLRVRGFERCFKVQFAAFHPIFFLHHANVDRIYEKHVQMETPEECVSLAAGVVTAKFGHKKGGNLEFVQDSWTKQFQRFPLVVI